MSSFTDFTFQANPIVIKLHIAMPFRPPAELYDRIPGLSKFLFYIHVFLLKYVHVKHIWVHVCAREIFETVKLLLASF